MNHPPRTRGRLEAQADHSRFTRHVVLAGAPLIRVSEIAGGPLLLAMLAALIWANSPWQDSYFAFRDTDLAVRLGEAEVGRTVREWIDDALMPLFFFVVGMEVKSELVEGQLARWKDAALPVLCALGGMAAPALIYFAFNSGYVPGVQGGSPQGWGITVATDIAFALAIVMLLGDQVPRAARVLLLAFAAVDDIGGILVIAVAYSGDIDWYNVGAAVAVLMAIYGLTRLRAVTPVLYGALAVTCWVLVERSGIHPTLAGVALGLLVPTRARVSKQRFAHRATELIQRFNDAHSGRDKSAGKTDKSDAEDRALGKIAELTAGTDKPVEKLSRTFNPWISYIVLPVFALANSGIELTPARLSDAIYNPVALGALAGLVIGKPVGFITLAWIAVRFNIARLPEQVDWRQIVALGVLAGIGFTVSLFIAELAFQGGKAEPAKVGILAASVISGAVGFVMLRWWALPAQCDEGGKA